MHKKSRDFPAEHSIIQKFPAEHSTKKAVFLFLRYEFRFYTIREEKKFFFNQIIVDISHQPNPQARRPNPQALQPPAQIQAIAPDADPDFINEEP